MNFCNCEDEDDDGVVGFLFLHQLNQNRLAITTANTREQKKQPRNTREREEEKHRSAATREKKTTGYALRDRTGQRETSHFPCGPLAAHHGPSRALFPFVCFYVFYLTNY
jgi:hypothetical protein